MKITSGTVRGFKIKTLDSDEIRPTLSRVRKSIFDLIGNDLLGESVLDLFAGSGALGLEALSRGAAHACFFEKSKKAVNLIKNNIKSLGFDDKATVFCKILPKGIETLKGEYSIILIDPPYNKGLTGLTLESISKRNLLKVGGVVVAQVGFKEELLDHYGQIVLNRQRKYGDTKLFIYEREES